MVVKMVVKMKTNKDWFGLVLKIPKDKHKQLWITAHEEGKTMEFFCREKVLGFLK